LGDAERRDADAWCEGIEGKVCKEFCGVRVCRGRRRGFGFLEALCVAGRVQEVFEGAEPCGDKGGAVGVNFFGGRDDGFFIPEGDEAVMDGGFIQFGVMFRFVGFYFCGEFLGGDKEGYFIGGDHSDMGGGEVIVVMAVIEGAVIFGGGEEGGVLEEAEGGKGGGGPGGVGKFFVKRERRFLTGEVLHVGRQVFAVLAVEAVELGESRKMFEFADSGIQAVQAVTPAFVRMEEGFKVFKFRATVIFGYARIILVIKEAGVSIDGLFYGGRSPAVYVVGGGDNVVKEDTVFVGLPVEGGAVGGLIGGEGQGEGVAAAEGGEHTGGDLEYAAGGKPLGGVFIKGPVLRRVHCGSLVEEVPGSIFWELEGGESWGRGRGGGVGEVFHIGRQVFAVLVVEACKIGKVFEMGERLDLGKGVMVVAAVFGVPDRAEAVEVFEGEAAVLEGQGESLVCHSGLLGRDYWCGGGVGRLVFMDEMEIIGVLS
jgi:hypothetical protein